MKKIKEIRLAKDKTQNELSRVSGVSQAYINELENGKKKNPSISILVKLANSLGVSVVDLIDEEVNKNGEIVISEDEDIYLICASA